MLAPALMAMAPPDTITTQHIDEVVVTGAMAIERLKSLDVGAEQLQLGELMAAPALLGEQDIMRSVQLLPGVKQESEASSGFQVRGGTSAQNLVLYDHAPVYNVGHLAGLFSAFNDDALGSAILYKGLLPPQYGNASAGVLDISSRRGSTERWQGSATLGLLSAKAAVEGPLASNKATLLLCGRRSYADMLLKAIPDYRDNTLYFYDLNARLDFQAGPTDQLQLSTFFSRDKTALRDMVSMMWQNLALSLTWRHQFSAKARLQTTAIASAYNTRNAIDLLGTDLSFSGHIRQGGLRLDGFLDHPGFTLAAGLQSMVYDVKSAEWQHTANHEKEQRQAWENAGWLNATLQLAPRWKLQAGARLTAFSSLGGPYYYETDASGNITWFYRTRHGRIVNTHLTFEPRASLLWQLAPNVSLKAAYTHSALNLHALRGQNTSTPFDRYTMSSNLIKPQLAHQLSAGVYAMTGNHEYDFSLEGYWRSIRNILDYRDGKSFASEIEMERLVLPGRGRCYGVELLARKNSGRLSGWLAYTLSWAENNIDGINGGRWYTAANDRRHDVDLVAIYKLSPQWKLSATWIYYSGQAFTAPSAKYEMIDNYIYYYAERNGYRAPDYHRLDLAVSWTRHLERCTREWQFGLYNVYNRYNPFLINFEDSDMGARTKATGYALFGIVPSVSLTVTF